MTRKLLFAAAAAGTLAQGHFVYLMPQKFRAEPGERIVVSVHSGDEFPRGVEAADPNRLVARVVTGDGVVPLGQFRMAGKATHTATPLAAGSQWLVVNTVPRVHTMEGEKFQAYLRDEGLDWAAAWRVRNGQESASARERYSKYAKAYVVAGAPSGTWKQAVGLTIEIVPLADPAALEPGDKLPVQVLWRGRPVADFRVEAAWAADGKSGIAIAGRTDRDGRIAVPLDRAGQWRLSGVAIERTAGDPEAEWESFWASLTFEIR
jgi:uncharacterized GH25 family protein